MLVNLIVRTRFNKKTENFSPSFCFYKKNTMTNNIKTFDSTRNIKDKNFQYKLLAKALWNTTFKIPVILGLAITIFFLIPNVIFSLGFFYLSASNISFGFAILAGFKLWFKICSALFVFALISIQIIFHIDNIEKEYNNLKFKKASMK